MTKKKSIQFDQLNPCSICLWHNLTSCSAACKVLSRRAVESVERVLATEGQLLKYKMRLACSSSDKYVVFCMMLAAPCGTKLSWNIIMWFIKVVILLAAPDIWTNMDGNIAVDDRLLADCFPKGPWWIDVFPIACSLLAVLLHLPEHLNPRLPPEMEETWLDARLEDVVSCCETFGTMPCCIISWMDSIFMGVSSSPLNPNKEWAISSAIFQIALGVSSKTGASGGPEMMGFVEGRV